MIKIAIVEDDESYVNQIKAYLVQYEKEHECEFKIQIFRDGDGITAHYKPEYDIILLDIEMPFVDGFSAAQMIREQDSEVVLIFITNIAQYAIKGYSVDALDYVLKPISYFSFSQYLTRAIARIKKGVVRYLTLTSKGSIYKVDISSICYVESQDHSLTFHTKNRDYSCVGKMQEIEQKLKDFDFYRCHISYLINLDYVEGFRQGFVIICGKELPVNRNKKKEFLQVMMEHINGV